MAIYRSRCAFREPYNGGFFSVGGVGVDIDVPDALVVQLLACGHIEPLPPEPSPRTSSIRVGDFELIFDPNKDPHIYRTDPLVYAAVRALGP